MKKMPLTAAASAILMTLGLFMTTPALAQTASQASTGWQAEITPYVWFTGIAGDITAGGKNTSISVGFSDILDSLAFGLMGMFQVRKGRIGFVVDGMYARLVKDGQTSGVVGQDIHAEIVTQLYSFAAAYKVIDGLYLGGGLRVMPISADLEVTSGILEGQQATGSNAAVDGFVGVRLELPLKGRFMLEGYADAGTGDSKLSWQALGGLRVGLSGTLSLKLGYRYLSIHNESADLSTTFGEGGFYLGVGIRL